MKYKLLILLLSYFLFTASTCEKRYNNENIDTPKLVINSIFSPKKPMQVSLDISRPVLDDEPRDLSGEFIEIIEPDGNIRILNLVTKEFKNWFVDSFFFPEVGKNYVINASATNFDQITSNNTIPAPVEIINATIDTLSFSKSDGPLRKTDMWISVDFQLEEKPGDHYYHLYAYRQKVRYDDDTGIIVYEYFDEHFINDFMEFNNPNGLIYTDNSLLFKDENGGSQNLSFEVGFTYFPQSEAIKSLRFELRTVSEEYYKFHVSKRKQELNAIDEFAEPIILFNNIEGGLGLFGGYSSVEIDSITFN